MTDRRFIAVAAVRVGRNEAVQIVRSYDGRIFAMSIDEARMLATQLEKAADQAEERRNRGSR